MTSRAAGRGSGPRSARSSGECERVTEALREAVATGAEPDGSLLAHLLACLGCRGAWDEERRLWAGLRALPLLDPPEPDEDPPG